MVYGQKIHEKEFRRVHRMQVNQIGQVLNIRSLDLVVIYGNSLIKLSHWMRAPFTALRTTMFMFVSFIHWSMDGNRWKMPVKRTTGYCHVSWYIVTMNKKSLTACGANKSFMCIAALSANAVEIREVSIGVPLSSILHLIKWVLLITNRGNYYLDIYTTSTITK